MVLDSPKGDDWVDLLSVQYDPTFARYWDEKIIDQVISVLLEVCFVYIQKKKKNCCCNIDSFKNLLIKFYFFEKKIVKKINAEVKKSAGWFRTISVTDSEYIIEVTFIYFLFLVFNSFFFLVSFTRSI